MPRLFISGVYMSKIVSGYGVVSLAHVKQYAQAVCEVLGRGNRNAAVYFCVRPLRLKHAMGLLRTQLPMEPAEVCISAMRSRLKIFSRVLGRMIVLH